MSTINPVNPTPYIPSVATPSTQASSASSSISGPTVAEDAIELSFAGRIAIDQGNGSITSDQAQQLDSQLNNLNQEIQTGGAEIPQMQSQFSQQIYGDAHNGATIPSGSTVTTAEARDFLLAGRIVAQENAGNLTSGQASQFFSQLGKLYQQSQNGASASSTNQSQNQLSAEVFYAAHNLSNPSGGS
jgi:hypothetical protein